MKLSQLKSIVKEAVKEAIQEEMKDILMEAVRSPKQTVYENKIGTSTTDVAPPTPTNPINVPLQVTSTDTMNGSLPQGEVNMDQIMGLMNKR